MLYYYYYYYSLAQHEKKDLVFLSAGYTSSQATSRSLRSRVSFAESLLSLRVPAFCSNSTLTDVPISLRCLGNHNYDNNQFEEKQSLLSEVDTICKNSTQYYTM